MCSPIFLPDLESHMTHVYACGEAFICQAFRTSKSLLLCVQRAQADQWRCTQHAVSAVISVVLGASPMSGGLSTTRVLNDSLLMTCH